MRKCPLVFLGALAFGVLFSAVRAEERVFFAFDDHAIPWQHNVKLTLVPAEKYPGNPVLRRGPEGAPDHGEATMYGTVIREGGKFRMWYIAMSQTKLVGGQAPGFWRPMCYAESADGIHWIKPDLGLVELNGNRHNNICRIEGEPRSLTLVDDFMSVLRDPEDPDPERRYKVAYIAHMPYAEIRGGLSSVGHREKRICAVVCAASADGLSWKVVGDRPANAGSERFEVSSLYRFGGFYYATGQLLSPWAWLADGSTSGRVMMAYRSPDFVHWSEGKAFSFARVGQLARPPVIGEQTHMGAGLWNRGNVLVGLYGMWQDPPKPLPHPTDAPLGGAHIDLGLIVSDDGIHFREPVPNFRVIPAGNPDEWDSTIVEQGNAFVNVGDRTLIWYSCGSNVAPAGWDIGLATLRRDGFGFLSCQQDGGDASFVTEAFTSARGGRLLLNVDGVEASAPLKVELLDGRDAPLAGYSGAAAATLDGNGVSCPAVWPNTGTADLPPGRPLEVRVELPRWQSSPRLRSLRPSLTTRFPAIHQTTMVRHVGVEST